MGDLSDGIILGCWVIFGVFWLLTAFTNKRTVERGGWGWPRALLFMAAWIAFSTLRRGHMLPASLFERLWPPATDVSVAAIAITVAGLAVTLWARVTLGRNWSGSVTFKENHELIVRGPYQYVRHPIYSGLLLMALGAFVEMGRAYGIVLVVMMGVSFWFKSRAEERLMLQHFPESYAEYRARVRALIPGVL